MGCGWDVNDMWMGHLCVCFCKFVAVLVHDVRAWHILVSIKHSYIYSSNKLQLLPSFRMVHCVLLVAEEKVNHGHPHYTPRP